MKRGTHRAAFPSFFPRRVTRGAAGITSLLLIVATQTAVTQSIQAPLQKPAMQLVQVRSVQIPRVSRPPRLEDFLAGVPRQAETRIDDFRQREPADGVPASKPTTAYLSYDAKNFYVVFVCEDEPEKIRARMSKRDDIGDDDQVRIYLDTFLDHQHAYIFGANPLGVQLDGTVIEGHDADFKFDTLWYSRGRLTGNGYIVWLAIPFNSLRFKNASPQTWGIALSRLVNRKDETAYWPYVSRQTDGLLQQMGTVNGMEQVATGRNIQIIPYATLTQTTLPNASYTDYQPHAQGRAGFDTKLVLHHALTLDATVNPDFSQVESDDPQVTINQRYEVYFPEKRAFFNENANYFQTPIDLFFSRRIQDPEFGARLTGQVGPWTLGALASDDRAPGELLQPADRSYGSRAMIGVFRLQRKIGDRLWFGGLVTSDSFGSTSNRVFAFDTFARLNPNWSFSAQVARSFSHDPTDRSLEGGAYFAEVTNNGEHFSYLSKFSQLGADFRTAVGFVPRLDVRSMEHYAAYYWRPENRKILSFGPSFSTTVDWDTKNQLQDWSTYADFKIDFARSTGVTVSRFDSKELFEGLWFLHGTTGIAVYSDWLRWLSTYASYNQGSSINYSPADGLPPFLGNSSEAEFGFTLHPKPRLTVGESYYFVNLRTRTGSELAAQLSPGEHTVYDNHLMRTKVNYQFSRALSVRAIVDYDALLANSVLLSDEPYKKLTGDLLVTYQLNPGTALFCGYTSNYENINREPFAPYSFGRFGPPGTLTGRQFFVKISYLLHL
jgi:hypothetical protein